MQSFKTAIVVPFWSDSLSCLSGKLDRVILLHFISVQQFCLLRVSKKIIVIVVPWNTAYRKITLACLQPVTSHAFQLLLLLFTFFSDVELNASMKYGLSPQRQPPLSSPAQPQINENSLTFFPPSPHRSIPLNVIAIAHCHYINRRLA